MSNKKVKSVQFNEINIKRNKSRVSITNNIHLFREKHKKSVYLLNSKKFQNNRNENENESLLVKRSKSTYRPGKIFNFIKKDKNINIIDEKVENKNIKELMTFTEIRQNIYKKLKKGYISPYIENYKVNQSYINNDEFNSFYFEPAKYYGYYQICHLTNNNLKNYRLLSKLHDHLLCNDSQEYIMKYFYQEEFYIIMKYLLYCIYERDKLLASNNHKKEKPDKNDIIDLYNKLHESIFHSEDTFDIFDNDRKFLKVVLSDTVRNRTYFTRLYTLFRININYVYIQDMPKEFIPNCIPNLFPHISKDIGNLKTYIKIKMNNNIDNIELLLNKSQKDKTLQKYFKNSNNNNERINRNKSFDDDFLFDNLSFSVKEEKAEINSILPRNRICNNKINDENQDFKEVKYLLNKFNAIKIPKIIENEKKLNQNDIFYKKIQKINSIKNKKEEYRQDLLKSTTNFSTIDNKSIMQIKNRNHFLNIDKKGSFKLSFNKTNSFSKTGKNTLDKSTIDNANFNEQIYKINLNDTNKIHYTRNKQHKKEIKILYEKKNINEDVKNLYIISRTSSGKTVNKDTIKPYYEKFFPKTVNVKRIIKERNNNKKYKTKYRKPSSYQNILNRYYLEKLEKNSEIKNKEINKNKIFMLCNFEKVYAETKRKGLLPKTKINYNIYHKPFKGIYGHHYFLDLLIKKSNREVEEENKVRDSYNLEKINKSIKNMLKSDILFFKNNYSLETIVKGPNLYSNY